MRMNELLGSTCSGIFRAMFVALFPTGAESAPVQTGDFPIPIEITDGSAGLDFDIDSDGTDDLNLAWWGTSVNSIFAWDAVVRAPTGSPATAIISLQDPNLNEIAKRLAAQQLIGPATGTSDPFTRAAYENFFDGTFGGNFYDETFSQMIRGYVGLPFDIGGNTHWGWADVSVDHLGDTGTGTLLLHGYGYETLPNTPVPAGAVPEPVGTAMLILGAAALGARRRAGGRGCRWS